MTPAEWQRVKEVFDTAVAQDPADRVAFLDSVCAGDQELRRRVDELLDADRSTGEFLSKDLGSVAVAAGIADFPGTRDGCRVGSYRILREIGRGGMGTVYLAERADGEFRKRVAVKLVNPRLGVEDVLRRFRNERQVLAALHHPNIARLLDGGTTDDGMPYLVMDYVEGTRIDSWCDRRKLCVNDRLGLFRKVCDAVQYAHAHQVIHRDLKPGNILVTSDGTPQLLDFGIAKVLDKDLSAETVATTIGPGPMTPEYASPEQARGDPVGPASDVYALGLLLYELLTGQLPGEREPTKPSAVTLSPGSSESRCESPEGLRRLLAGDLDNVALKALREEPSRRYATVAELSEDVERFMQNQAVKARPETVYYRSFTFLRRHRAVAFSATAGALLVVALGTGLGGSAARKDYRTSSRQAPSVHWDRLRFEKIAVLGGPAPGGGSFTKDFEPYGLNNRGDLAFAADLSQEGEGVFLRPNRGAVLPVARHGQPAPGGGTFDRTAIGVTAINESRVVAFVFGLTPFNAPELKGFARAGLYRYSYDQGKLTPVVIPGVTEAPGFGAFQTVGYHASLNQSGEIVFPGLVKTAAGSTETKGLGYGIFVARRDGTISKVVAPGDPAPGGSTFDYAMNPWINDQGDVAFGAHVAGEECLRQPLSGPYCMESIYLKNAATQVIESVAHQSETMPSGLVFRGAWGPVLNNRGDLLFMGELTPHPTIGSARGAFLRTRGIIRPIAGPGDVMPDGRQIVTTNPANGVGNYSLNNLGDVSFNAFLENGESGLYVQSQDGIHLIAGTGTVIPGVGTVASVADLINGGTLNDLGQVFFWATLTNGSGALLLATPEPRTTNR